MKRNWKYLNKRLNRNDNVAVLHTTSPRTFQRSQDDVNCKDVKLPGLDSKSSKRSYAQFTLTLFMRGFFLKQKIKLHVILRRYRSSGADPEATFGGGGGTKFTKVTTHR